MRNPESLKLRQCYICGTDYEVESIQSPERGRCPECVLADEELEKQLDRSIDADMDHARHGE